MPMISVALEAQQHALAAIHRATDLNLKVDPFSHRQEDVGPGAKLDHTEALPCPQFLARLEPADDAASNRAGDLLHPQRPPGRDLFQVQPELLIPDRAGHRAGIQEAPRKIADFCYACPTR